MRDRSEWLKPSSRFCPTFCQTGADAPDGPRYEHAARPETALLPCAVVHRLGRYRTSDHRLSNPAGSVRVPGGPRLGRSRRENVRLPHKNHATKRAARDHSLNAPSGSLLLDALTPI